MKKISKILIALLLVIVAVFCVAGCNAEQELYYTYNEAGDFYEQESDAVISATVLIAVSGPYRYMIEIEYDDENIVFLFIAESGHLVSVNGEGVIGGTELELKSGEACRWGFDTYLEEVWDHTIYVDIVAKVEDKIVGYGVIGFFSAGTYFTNPCEVLKFAFIPQIKGVYQSVTENQVKNAIQAVKNS